jgi:hypothetical protein
MCGPKWAAPSELTPSDPKMIPSIEEISQMLREFATWYSTHKSSLGELTGASQELLHVHAGLLIFIVAALVLRRKMRSPIPLTIVVFFAALNEVVDWISGGPPDTLEPLWDFANTVFWPFLLFLIARRWR